MTRIEPTLKKRGVEVTKEKASVSMWGPLQPSLNVILNGLSLFH